MEKTEITKDFEERQQARFVEDDVLARESLKLTKNSKGYNWEIKILDLDIEKISKLNTEFKRRFGKDEIKGKD